MASGELLCSVIFKAAFGCAEDEPLGRAQLLARIHPDDQLYVVAAMQAAVEGRGDYHTEYLRHPAR